MSYYYLTTSNEIWKKVGARKVRCVYLDQIYMPKNITFASFLPKLPKSLLTRWIPPAGMSARNFKVINSWKKPKRQITFSNCTDRCFNIAVFKASRRIKFESKYYNTVWFELAMNPGL